jgi:hypothetical protein
MATIDSKEFIDNIIRNNGFHVRNSEFPDGDNEEAPDNPRCVKIVEYTNFEGITTWGVMFQGDNLNKYKASNYVTNPRTIWEYNKSNPS